MYRVSFAAINPYASWEMKSKEQPPSHVRPAFRLDFKGHSAWVGYLAAIAGLTLLLFPEITAKITASSTLRVAGIVLCVMVALVGFTSKNLLGNVYALYGRVRDYPGLHGRATADSDSVEDLRQNALQLMLSTSAVEQDYEGLRKGVVELAAQAFEERSFRINKERVDKGHLVIVLEDHEASLSEGDKILVVDTADKYPMGTFEVIEKRRMECYAIGGADVDGLWLADRRRSGETSVIIEKVAILVERSGE